MVCAGVIIVANRSGAFPVGLLGFLDRSSIFSCQLRLPGSSPTVPEGVRAAINFCLPSAAVREAIPNDHSYRFLIHDRIGEVPGMPGAGLQCVR
jgi:hypothetical protein